MFAFSAPGKSPAPLPINIREIIPNIRRDVISEVHRGIADTQAMVHDIRNMLKSQQGTGGQLQLVSITRTPSLTEYTLTVV